MTMFGSQWFAAPDTTYEIDQSIRFNDDDSSYLNRTPGSAGDRRTFTFSCWVKRANITSANCPIFSAGGDDWLMFLSANTLGFNTSGSNYRIVTTQVFRDPGAWFHLVLRVDTTNSTAGDRLRLYINGSEVTDFGTDTNPTLNFETSFNNTGEHDIGKLVGASQFFDGYLAEINHVDGSSLAPSSFGETNSTTGQWVPKAYSGSYGTNGFYLKGQDSSALGDDTSGNGNDFSSSGLAAADQMSDSPTDNHCTLNPLWVDGHTLSDGNLVASAAADSAAIGTMAFDVTDSDGYYFEAKVTTAATYPNVGIRTVESPSQVGAVTSLSGNSTGRYSFTGSDGNFNDAGSSSSYGSAWAGTADKVIGVLVKAGALYFSIDGTIQNSGTAAKTGLTGYMLPTVFYDAGSGTSAAWEMRFDSSDWGTSPSGYKAISSNNLADPTIEDPKRYFGTLLYTGNGTTGQTVTGLETSSGTSWTPDWVWIKPRSAAYNSKLFDSVRTLGFSLESSTNNAEADLSAEFIGFADGGFQVDDNGSNNINQSGITHVGWCWEAGGSGSSNGDGDITSTVSASTTSGFSALIYSGSGTSGDTVGHGLGVKPSAVLVKTRNASDHWIINDWAGDYANKLKLNETEAASSSSGFVTAASSSTFTLGSDIAVNGSGRTYVAYCFAEIEGYSKISSYTGNGSASAGPFVYTGFSPQWILFRVTSTSDAWQIYDTKRYTINPFGTTIAPNSNAVESSFSARLDILSNGFKVRTTNTALNGSGEDYIFMAFAESPFKTANAQ